MSDRRIQDILESITDAFVAVDHEWRYTYINERALRRMQGRKGEELPPEAFLGKKMWEVFPEAVGTTIYEKYHEAVRETKTVEFETYFPPSDEWIEAHAYPSEEGLAIYYRDITERKRAEAEQQRLADIVQNSSDFIGICDLDWQVIFLNDAGQRMVGLNGIQEVRRTRVPDYFAPEDLASVGDEMFATVLEEGRWVGELNLRHFETGELIPVLWDVFRLDDPRTGEPANFATITRDISERKRAEEALRESHRRIENILESITDEFNAFDRQWRFTYINESGLNSIQRAKGQELTREEVLGENMWEMFPEHVGSVFYQNYHEAMREQKSMEFEALSPVTDRWIEAHLYPSEEGLSVYYRDITERKEAEKEIEPRVRQQAAVAELGLEALAGDDLDSLMDEVVACLARTLGAKYAKIVELLPGGEELLLRSGVGFEEGLVGRATESAGLGSQAGYTLLSEEPVIAEDFGAETRFRPPPLVHERGALSGVSVVIQGRGGPFGVLGAFATRYRSFSEDDANFLQAVANVLATAIERQGAEERVEEGREAERSRIARNLHDEPLQDLTDVLVQTQQIRSLSEDPQQTLRLVRLLATLDRIGPQLRGAIYDLRLQGEHDKLFPELLESLVELHRTMAPQSDITLELHDGVLSGPLGERGRQVLRILGEALTNVRRHSGAHNIRVGVGITEEKLWAEVEDDGRGFDAAQEEEEDSEDTLSAIGRLGIRGMRERARALGGDLQIESDSEKGTRVRFEMTLKKEDEEPERGEEEARVLLVEDHATVRDALLSMFEGEAGLEVVGQAESLAQARRMLETESVDVAIVELGLPDGSGGDLIKELREANPKAQALVLSASLDRVQIARAVEAGAAGVLHKTVHLEEVVGAVRRLRAGQTLMPLEEVVELLRFASSRREEEYEARRAVESLTPREIEVLQALALGLDSKGIAERLHISLRTERNHMTSILSKLEVHSQLQALVFALRCGVVEIH
jgi:PAS domain S-box-containing protein